MPPPRRQTRGALSTYDREMLQAIADRRLDPADPDAQAVLQRVNAPPTDEVWLSMGGPDDTPAVDQDRINAELAELPSLEELRLAQAADPPPQYLHTGEAVERAQPDPITGGFSTRSAEPDVDPEQELYPWQRAQPEAERPQMPTFGSLGREAWEHVGRPAWDVAKGIATQTVGRNPYPQALQDRLREQGLPTNPRIGGPWNVLEAATGALPATAGALYDAVTGETDPTIPDLVHDPPTWERTAAERGAPKSVQTIGKLADLLLGPEDFVPGASIFGAAVPIGRALGKAVTGATKASTLIPPALRGLKNVLGTKDWNTFRKAVERTPGAQRPLSMLLPSEIGPLTRSVGGVTRFVDTYNRLPDANYLASAIRRGAPKRGWYANSRQALTEILGEDADMFTGLLAAMSPQTSVESNLTNALNVFVNWRRAGRPQGSRRSRTSWGAACRGVPTRVC